jgi:hypothetical protein
MKLDQFVFTSLIVWIVASSVFTMLDAAIYFGSLVVAGTVIAGIIMLWNQREKSIFKRSQKSINVSKRTWTIEELEAYNRKLINDYAKYFDSNS